MPGEEATAIATLGGFGIEEVLSDLNPEAVSGLRTQLGLETSNFGYDREDLLNGKYADDDDDGSELGFGKGTDWEDEVDKEVRREIETERNRGLVMGGIPRVRGEVHDYDDDDDDIDTRRRNNIQNPVMLKIKGETVDEDMALYDEYHPPAADPVLERSIYDLYPTFEPGAILQFTDLLGTMPRKRQKVSSASYIKIAYPSVVSKVASTSVYLNGSRTMPPRSAPNNQRLAGLLAEARAQLREEIGLDAEQSFGGDVGDADQELERVVKEAEARGGHPIRLPKSERDWEALSMGDWEQTILLSPTQRPSTLSRATLSEPLPAIVQLSRPRNPHIDAGDWTKSIIWDSRRPWKPFDDVVFTEDDPDMLLQLRNLDDEPPDVIAPCIKLKTRSQATDMLNLSNDRLYEATRDDKKRIRQTFGNLEIQHSYPATKLQLPYFKVRLNKADARSWHRPALQFPISIPITFTKVKQAKKKKDKMGRKLRSTADASEILKASTDLTLKDTSPFVLYEFSEEAPPIMSNYGMGSMIVNYYRKKDAKDDFIPTDEIGEPFLLDANDESPFMKFGSIKSGEKVPTLYNNLIRAPLFRHKPQSTDFLIVRTTVEGETNYYIRPIETLFVVGQTYPMTEVPGPGSRKLTTLAKNRLQSITFKLCERTPKNRIKINRLMKYYTDQTELQMRQRLKDFMEYQRKGPNQGFWLVKPTIKVPEKEEMFKLVTPEGICLSESMQVGQRHLADAGYGNISGGNEAEEEKDDSKLDLEQLLAPWAITKNFVQAVQHKAMLKLHGEGDPSGRGEAFSCIRVSMKDIFLREGESMEDRQAEIAARPKSAHRYNVNEQQDIYKQEIERIWRAQIASLSNPNPPELTMEDEMRARGRQRDMSVMAETPWTAGAPTPGDWSRRDSASPGLVSRASSPEKDDMSTMSRPQPLGAGKAVRIRRLIDGKWQTEVVRDPAVVKAYLRQRDQVRDREALLEEDVDLTDPERAARHKEALKAQLDKMVRERERREARHQAKAEGLPAPTRRKPQGDTTRRCGNCGQVGHMKTNRKCPRWAEFNTSLAAPAASPACGGLSGPPGSLGSTGIAGLGVISHVTPSAE